MKKIFLMIISCLASVLVMYGQNGDWRFAVVGDTHVPQAYTIRKILPSLIENKVEVVLFSGDLIQGGKGQTAQGMYEELSQWQELTQPLRDAGIKIIAIRGNHEADVKGDNLKAWKELLSPDLNLVYSYRNVTFIGMDNYLNGEHTVDTGWLQKALKKANKEHIIVPFGHEPAFSCNTFHPVCLDADESNRNRFWSLLEDYGIDYYFCGHTHQYNHCIVTHNGKTIHQIVSGGGGGFLQPKRGGIHSTDEYQIKPVDLKSETGYVLVNVSDRDLSVKWVNIYDEDVRNRPIPQRKKRPQGR